MTSYPRRRQVGDWGRGDVAAKPVRQFTIEVTVDL